MAAIALAVAGAALGPSIFGATAFTVFGTAVTGAALGGILGGGVGAIIDRTLVYPALFRQTTTGPRLDDFPIQQASEGAPLSFCMGPECPVSGKVIWCTDLIEETSDSGGGKGGGGGGDVTSYVYFVHLAVVFTDHEITRFKKIWADSKLIYDADSPINQDGRFEDIALYTGTLTQNPDALIEATEGAGNVSAHRGKSYIRITKLALADFGNRIPTISALVEAQETLTAGEAITQILERAGLDATQYDTSRVPGCIRGYTIEGPQTPESMLAPIMTKQDLVAQENSSSGNGVLVFKQRGDDLPITIQASDIGCHEPGGDSPRVVRVSDKRIFDMPSKVSVEFIDPTNDYQRGSRPYRRTNPPVENIVTAAIPIVMDPDEARSIAKRILWSTWAERREIQFQLPASYLKIEEGDRLIVPIDGVDQEVRVTEINQGANFLLEITGVIEEGQTLDFDSEEDESTIVPLPPYTPPAVQLVLADLPPLTSDEIDRVGRYFGIAAIDTEAQWRGASLFQSRDGGTSYSLDDTISNEGIIGQAETVLANGNLHGVDRLNSIDITLFNGTLASCTERQFLEGENTALLGGEIIAFKTVTSLSPNRYRLSYLLRGLKNTESSTTTHAVGESFMLLRPGTTKFKQASLTDLGASRYFKGVASGDSINAVAAVLSTLTAETLKPYSPCHVKGSRDASNNLTLTWVRRTRIPVRLFAQATTPVGELTESYSIDVLDGGGSVIASLTKTASSPTVGYTAAELSGAGLTPANPITVEVYQVSATVGRGRKKRETV